MMYPRCFSFLTGFSAAVLMLFQTSVLAEPTPRQALEQQLPDLLNMIQERQSVLKQALNKQGMSYQTFDIPLAEKNMEISANVTLAQAISPNANVQLEAFRDGLRDPFTPTKKMIEQAGVEKGTHSDFQLSSRIQALPKLSLRGIIMQAENSSPLALLDITGNGVHMVRIGDEISFNTAEPKQVLKIQSITRLSVTVEVGTLGDLIVVR